MEAPWSDPGFRRLWFAMAISDSGSAVNRLALPLTAIGTLDAGAREMGLLVALQQLPVPLFGLFAGVFLDRVRRRPVMIAADVSRGLLLALVPLLAWHGSLEIVHLLGIAFAVGSLTVCFDLAVTSHLPDLVPRSALLEANSGLQASTAVTSVAGPGVGGWMVQWLGAPQAVGLDALSFLGSAFAVARIRPAEAVPVGGSGRGLRAEIGEGWRLLMGHPVLRPITVASMFGAGGAALQQSVLVLFATRDLGVPPAGLGLVFAAGGAGALLGSLRAGSAARRLGVGRALIAASFVSTLGYALILAAGGRASLTIGVLAVAQLLSGAALGVFSVNQISLRQQLTPPGLLGRVNAARRVLVFGALPLGAVAGGLLGEWAGLRAPILASSVASAVGCALLWRSPIRRFSGAEGGPIS